jgi:hypothetical protein
MFLPTVLEGRKRRILASKVLASPLAATATAQKVTPLLTRPMPEQPGRQIEVITVDFAPGAVNPVVGVNPTFVLPAAK